MLTLMFTLCRTTPDVGPCKGIGSLGMLWGYPYRNYNSVDNICMFDNVHICVLKKFGMIIFFLLLLLQFTQNLKESDNCQG